MAELDHKPSESSVLVWVAVIALLGFGALIVAFYSPPGMSQANACINNLRQIDGAKNEWALETGKTNGTACTEEDIKPFIKLDAKGMVPHCPQGGIYTIGEVGKPPICSLGKTKRDHVLPQLPSGDGQ